ncbi:MAG: dethiobiotin synthase [Mycobacteriales bacterium]
MLVTGTGTGVGKTTVATAVACLAAAAGARVAVVKPAQTGEPDGGGGDLAEVLRRVPTATGIELVRYPDPLSPAAAARRSGRPALTLSACLAAIERAQRSADLVLVEGAGGLLVDYDDAGLTIATVAAAAELPVLLVTAAGLGTLNATALTVEALTRRSLALAGLVIGDWPAQPDLAMRCNICDLERITGQPLAGALPADAARLDDDAFLLAARNGIGPGFGGEFDAAAFRRATQP